MPALPWVERAPIDPTAAYLAMATYLPLRRYRSIPGFLRDTWAIRRQLAEAPGLAGYTLDAQVAGRRFWTFSVWQDRASLDAFTRAEPHRSVMARLRPLMGETRFSAFEVVGAALPLG